MATITGIRPTQVTFTPVARLGVGALAIFAALLLGAAVGLGVSLTMLIMGLLAPFAVLAVLARPYPATIIYIVLVYGDLLSIMVRYDGMPSLARFAGIGLLTAALGYRIFIQRERLAGDRITLWMLAYGAVVALGLIYARDPDIVMTDVIEFARNFFTYLIIINIITTSPRLHTALYALLGAGTALASLTLFQSFTGTFDNEYGGLAQYRVSDITGDTEAARPGGTLGDANYYGQLLLILIPIALYLMLEGKSVWARLAGAGSAAILTAGVIFTYSRGDAIALAVMLAAAVVYKKPRPVWIVAGLVLLAVSIPLLPSNYVARMLTVVDVAQGDQQIYMQDDSILGRTGATQAAIEMFLDHPILGVGRENYPLYQPDYLAGTIYARVAHGIPPHDLYLEVAAENGIIGLIIFGAFLLATFAALRDAWRRFKLVGMDKEKELIAWLAIMLIGYLVSALSLHGAFLYILFLQISLIAAARLISRSHSTVPLARAAYSTLVLTEPAYADTRATGSLRERITGKLDEIAARVSPIQGKPIRRVALMQQAPEVQPPEPAFDSGWLAAAAAALMRGNMKVAHAMVELAISENPYDPAAWALKMRLQQVEWDPEATVGLAEFSADAQAYQAAEAGNPDNATPNSDLQVSDRFYNYWRANGGVPIFGAPVSPLFAEIDGNGNMLEVQYFERARLEYHRERAGTPFEIATGKLGLEVPARGTVELHVPSGLDKERIIFSARGTGMPTPLKFFSYWEHHGGPRLFGYPITPLLIDSDGRGKALAVQYFEKGRLEYHPELAATVYEVQVSKLGAEVFAARYGLHFSAAESAGS